MPSPQDIIDYAGQFADLPLSKISLFISKASLSVEPAAAKWDHLKDFAILLLTCHLLTLAIMQEKAMQQGAIGPVTSETVGDLSRSYADGQVQGGGGGGSDSLDQTSYGREFKRLQSSLVITPLLF
jgi:hypothetical protein